VAQEYRVRVARKEFIARDVALLDLVAVRDEGLPSFSAGAHIDVQIKEAITRQYSLCNKPTERHRYQIAVLRTSTSRGGSMAIHDDLHVGDELTISAPRNHFPLAEEAPHHLLLAGGIGITPLLCMAERLTIAGHAFHLHYCARSPDRTAFRQRIHDSPFAHQVSFHFDNGPSEQLLNLVQTVCEAPSGSHLYTCGPKGFIAAALAAARGASWPETRIHYEFFSAERVQPATDSAFDVQLASSSRVVRVAADQTIVAALAAAGIVVPTSCEQGVCGTCLTRVLGGEPDHRDLFLTDDEHAANDQFLPCCSRSKTQRLVLDL